MILGFSHLAWTAAASWEEDAARLRDAGYSLAFRASGVPNPIEKRPLLSVYHSDHDLALYRHEGSGLAVERIDHRSVGSLTAPECGPYRFDWHEPELLRLHCRRIEEERSFWMRALGFRSGSDADELVMHRPVASWSARMRLVSDAAVKPSRLDDPGHGCVAFVVSSLERDLAAVIAAGAREATPVFTLSPNGQSLRIALFRTPGGAICEFLQPPATARSVS
ncbi:MAG: hypothetical protein HQM00_02670 [Magnetococcales bacterium]|nr:hypothetical protein [Magnetococcales bacterium]